MAQHQLAFEMSEGNSTKIVSSRGNSAEEHRLLFIAILTHWRGRKRRASIRETWMTQCTGDKVKCLFFTDLVGAKESNQRLLQTEISWNDDMIVMPMPGNISDIKYCNAEILYAKSQH